jgi:lysophospholipase L1-like esterase
MMKIPYQQEPLEMNGLPWFEQNENRLWRLPIFLEERISRALWLKSRNTSGARIRFSSDTTMLGIELKYPAFWPMHNMQRIGQMGLDVYVDGVYWNSVWPEEEGIAELIFFDNAPRKKREFIIYLPLYHSLELHKIIFDYEAKVTTPAPFQTKLPVVYYGTSITQGGCASRSGLSYQAILSRDLNIDFVNLGFSGLGVGEIAIAEAIATLDVSCYVLDYGQNNESVLNMEQAYLPFIQAIRKQKPLTPILLTTLIPYSSEQWNLEFRTDQEAKRQVVRNAYEVCIAAGDQHIYLIEGELLLQATKGDGQVDGAHPNDLGFMSMANVLKAKIKEVLLLN